MPSKEMVPTSQSSPRISIVIAAWNGRGPLRECLLSLEKQSQAEDTEIIVASNFDQGTAEMLRTQFPHVKHVRLPEDMTVPILRTTGISHAQGEIVALFEDHSACDDRWCAEIKKAHELPYAIIGGAIENASPDQALNWAVYLYDYGPYMLPGQPGVVRSLSGMNVSYKRSVLAEVEEHYREGFFEAFVHEELQTRGHALYLMPSAVVYHRKNYEFGATFVQCFHLARSFAARRLLQAAPAKRLVFAAGSLFLPIVLTARTAARTIQKRRHGKQLLRALPWLLLLMASWGAGELCGYLAGEGRSAAKWK